MQPSQPTSPQLSPENLRELASAKAALRKINRAVSVARFDGWTIAIFAGLTFLMGMTSPTNIILALGLGTVAYLELSAASRLRRLDPTAVKMLGLNQLGLAAVLIIYALWQIHAQLSSGGELISTIQQYDAADAQNIANLERPLVILFYSALIAVAVLGMGGMSWFYFSRAKHLADYLNQTPQWILDMQKSGVEL